ncbi:MFS transporter [Roseateles sp. DAIF2]|uniref:MFS transporter n=1 Tax=Roseateles sp. DAIF2 TaxID=2714952 RepID=UPI0018A2A5A2|nr:MFS transporter [Roseateles sp. DAIF2]QPF72837.1 MFS transporter [Roseateles sp. DAIF2]
MAPAQAGERRALLALVATMISVHACMASTRVAASLWALQRGYGEWTVGVLLSLLSLAPVFLALWAGRQVDRFGFHRPMRQAVVMAAVGALAALAWPNLATIVFSCLLNGGATAVAGVATQREAGRMADTPAELKRMFGYVALSQALSNALTPVLSGLLIDFSGFRAAFAFSALLPLLAWLAVRHVPRRPVPAQAAAGPARAAWQLLREPALRNLLILNVVLSAAWDAHSFVVPVLGHAKGLSASSIGLVLGSFAAAATLVRLAIVRWAQHLDELKALRLAMTTATVVLVIYAWLPGTPGLLLGSAILGMALGSVQPMILATLHQVTPEQHHGQALGLRMMLSNGATVTMPLGFGVLAAATFVAAPMWLMASLLLAAQWPARQIARQRSPSA